MPCILRVAVSVGLLAFGLSAQGAQFVVRTPPALAPLYLFDAKAADLDGDGDLDLCGPSIQLFVPRHVLLRNDGAERFTDVSANLPPASQSSQTMLPFDMDLDGDLDLFVSPGRLWRNQGNLTFVDASANLPAGVATSLGVEAVDFDGDGDLDLAMVGLPLFGYSRILVNQGNGVFAVSPGTVPTPGFGLTTADFDQDGDADIAVAGTSVLKLLRNDGSWVFTDVTPQWMPGVAPFQCTGVTAADFDGDGVPDLWTSAASGSQLWRFASGAFAVASSLPSCVQGHSFVVADVDEDDDLDLVSSNLLGPAVQLAVNDGTGNFALAPSRLSIANVGSSRLTGGDFDGDGDVDFVVADSAGPSRLVLNRHRDLVPGQPVVGQTWNVQMASEPGYATLHHTARLAIAVAALPSPATIPGVGDLWLDLSLGYVFFENVVFAGSGQCTFPFVVPPSPSLVGLPLYLQGLLEQYRAPTRLTAHFRVVVQ
ncbi:MAG: VCBS repeat-containing protein [Planctomycetes bacterium]|nr:VCBS repeat-containing protein [Planctomycetota bacterium]